MSYHYHSPFGRTAIPIQMQGRRMSSEIADHRVAIQIDFPPKNTDGWILLRSRKKNGLETRDPCGISLYAQPNSRLPCLEDSKIWLDLPVWIDLAKGHQGPRKQNDPKISKVSIPVPHLDTDAEAGSPDRVPLGSWTFVHLHHHYQTSGAIASAQPS